MSSTNNTYLNDDHQLRLKALKLENDALELAISNLREKSKKLAYFISVHQQACTHVDENRKLQIKKIGFEGGSSKAIYQCELCKEEDGYQALVDQSNERLQLLAIKQSGSCS